MGAIPVPLQVLLPTTASCDLRKAGCKSSPVLDDVGVGHEIRHKLVELPLVLEPDALERHGRQAQSQGTPFDVHADPTEVGLICEVDALLAQRAVTHLTISIFEPLLAGINPVNSMLFEHLERANKEKNEPLLQFGLFKRYLQKRWP